MFPGSAWIFPLMGGGFLRLSIFITILGMIMIFVSLLRMSRRLRGRKKPAHYNKGVKLRTEKKPDEFGGTVKWSIREQKQDDTSNS
jgi:hypothetical protein